MPDIRGAVSGGVRATLRVEGLFVLAASCMLYAHTQHRWGLFFVFFLLPDLSFAGYLAGPKIGAVTYNVVHSYSTPIALGILFYFLKIDAALPFLFIWTAHIGFDRALGYGLKYATGFGNTHLGMMGKPKG
jgi:hypothetical protein